jgi:hypothetical protein
METNKDLDNVVLFLLKFTMYSNERFFSGLPDECRNEAGGLIMVSRQAGSLPTWHTYRRYFPRCQDDNTVSALSQRLVAVLADVA